MLPITLFFYACLVPLFWIILKIFPIILPFTPIIALKCLFKWHGPYAGLGTKLLHQH